MRARACCGALGANVVTLPSDGQLSAARGRNAGYTELKSDFPNAMPCNSSMAIASSSLVGSMRLSLSARASRSRWSAGGASKPYPDASIYNALCDQEWNTPIGEANECGGDALVRVEAFDQVGGYRPTSGGRGAGNDGAHARGGLEDLAYRCADDRTRCEYPDRFANGGEDPTWRFGYAQVWQATKGFPERLYGRNLRSAFVWSVALPLIVISLAIVAKAPILLLRDSAFTDFSSSASAAKGVRPPSVDQRGSAAPRQNSRSTRRCSLFPQRRLRTVPEYKAHGNAKYRPLKCAWLISPANIRRPRTRSSAGKSPRSGSWRHRRHLQYPAAYSNELQDEVCGRKPRTLSQFLKPLTSFLAAQSRSFHPARRIISVPSGEH